jgi:hypothetical protein
VRWLRDNAAPGAGIALAIDGVLYDRDEAM